MDALPVTLIVKAPNQQFEDQTIKCEQTWSIRKLKGYLSEVYPCNPSLEEQKLIYSGQLLNDAHILKDVLRQYEGQETHTVHLVYTPKNKNYYSQQSVKKPTPNKDVKQPPQQRAQPPKVQTANSTASDGLRQRNTMTNAGQQSNQQRTIPLPTPPPFMSGILTPPQPFMPGMSFMPMPSSNQPQPQYTPEQYAIAQQMAMQNMMHQMYLQYLNHYANAMQSNGQDPNFASSMPYFPQNFDGSTSAAAQPSPAQYQNVYARDQVEQPEPQVQPQPRIQNDEEAENRDWLEILYTFSRLIVLLSLVYFYSSPGRCSIVIFAMVLYYFYQNHQRNLRERQVLENQIAAAAQEVDADVTVDNTEQNENDQTTDSNESAENAENANQNVDVTTANEMEIGAEPVSTTTAEQEENNRLPTITLLRTFVLSFFASLIPETPAV